MARRLEGIQWVRNLPREGLEHGVRERQVLLRVTEQNERVYLQYPGFESTGKDPKPWDFRPKVEIPGGPDVKDLGFRDIWDALFESLGRIGGSDFLMSAVATLFYRMAYMKDHRRSAQVGTPESRIVLGGVRTHNASEGAPLVPPPWAYFPPVEVFRAIGSEVAHWSGMSLEAFLHYNDILAWNEDCKYYHRDTGGGAGPWPGGPVGRINNLLTHVRVIGLVKGQIKLTSLLGGLSKQGVSPVTKEESIAVCGPYLSRTD